MVEWNPWLRCALAVLAAWRVSHLLAKEDGPGDILVRLRRWFGESWTGKLMDCFYCLSLWVSAPLALWAVGWRGDAAVVWLSISAGACLLERLGDKPVIIEEWKGETHGVLRTEQNSDDSNSGVRYETRV